AVVDELLVLRVPALAADRLAGQIDDGVAAGERRLPLAGQRRVALDDLDPVAQFRASALRRARQHHHLVAARDEGLDERRADEPAAAGDEDPHHSTALAPRPGATGARSRRTTSARAAR